MTAFGPVLSELVREKRTHMNEFQFLTAHPAPPASDKDASSLFLWRGSGIVLLGAYESGHWVLARGWLAGDRLEHVRRWTFAQPIPFSGQVRRLVMEAQGDFTYARDEGFRALAWAETLA